MNLSKFFIDRPIFAGVLSVLMVVAGLIALRGLPISNTSKCTAPPSWCAPSTPAPTPR